LSGSDFPLNIRKEFARQNLNPVIGKSKRGKKRNSRAVSYGGTIEAKINNKLNHPALLGGKGG